MHRVEIWRLDLASGPDGGALHRVVSADELVRAARFLDGERARRYIAACGQVRQVLSTYVDIAPEALVFERNAFGKPALADRDTHFNVSRSGDIGVLAISDGSPVGVDIEHVRAFDWEPLAQREFSEDEYEALTAVAPEERLAAFFRCWTLKEAIVKAIGEGLSIPLKAFSVTVDDPRGPRLVAFHDHAAAEAPWRLAHFSVADGVAGAVAVPVGAPLDVIQRTWG